MRSMWRTLWAQLSLYRLAALTVAGHRFWLLPLLTLLWPAALAAASLFGLRGGFEPDDAQGIMAVPMTALAIFLGLRVIAGEIDGRSLEIAYTVPGGCQRVWWAKLAGGVVLLLAAEALLAVTVRLLFGLNFPLGALYGAMQAAIFYMVLSMAMATLFRSEVAGGMVTVALLVLNGLFTGFGENQGRGSPFFNPLAARGVDAEQLLGWTVQNRIGVALVTCGIASLAFMRANRRERMLDS